MVSFPTLPLLPSPSSSLSNSSPPPLPLFFLLFPLLPPPHSFCLPWLLDQGLGNKGRRDERRKDSHDKSEGVGRKCVRNIFLKPGGFLSNPNSLGYPGERLALLTVLSISTCLLLISDFLRSVLTSWQNKGETERSTMHHAQQPYHRTALSSVSG